MPPQLHLGNMTFGWKQASSFVDHGVAKKMMDMFSAAGGKHFDTARIYAAGVSEEMTGKIFEENGSASKFVIATKAHPSQEGGLSAHGIRSQLKASLDALKINAVDMYYLHQPDTEHPLTESLETIDLLIKEGLIKSYGISNYSSVEVDRLASICKEKSYPLPVVYQGLYNPVNRRVEDELFPTLQKYGISFVAYNPLAGGMLTGKHQKDTDVKDGRFKNNANYYDRYYKDDVFAGLELIASECEKAGISMVEATYRWMMTHSQLGEKDGLLLGASALSHLESNLKCCNNTEPLPQGLLTAFDEAWKICKPDAFAFWRSYSADMPGREALDPGASYDAAKK